MDNVHSAEDHIVCYLAVNTGVRVAWALDAISDEDIGGIEVPESGVDLHRLELFSVDNAEESRRAIRWATDSAAPRMGKIA